jgi:predicted PurR-regulated permease PerM
MISPDERTAIRASWVLATAAALAVLHLHLLPALLAGLLVYELVHLLTPYLEKRIFSKRGRVAAVAILGALIVALAAAAITGAVVFFRSDAGNLSGLFGKMAQIIENSRASLPDWLNDLLPPNGFDPQMATVQWLREHAAELRQVGKEAGLAFAHIIVGMVIGAMLATREVYHATPAGPLATSLVERATRLGDAFRNIVFAQLRISAINTVFTAIYLAVVLPLFGVHLPFTKTLIAVTFIAGLLPVIGNLISNSVIVVVSLAHSPQIAAASLAFLVIVHKFEYFLNARIVGRRINARAWEILTAMVVMEAAFGIAGLIAAPIFYAWLKSELKASGMV